MKPPRKTIWIGGGIVGGLLLMGLLFPVAPHGHQITHRQASQITMQNLVSATRAYLAEYGEWPQGNSAAVTRALSGGNPRKMVFLEIGNHLNASGEPTDAWGTTLALAFSGVRVEVRSAGKDKTFDTADDLILPEP